MAAVSARAADQQPGLDPTPGEFGTVEGDMLVQPLGEVLTPLFGTVLGIPAAPPAPVCGPEPMPVVVPGAAAACGAVAWPGAAAPLGAEPAPAANA